MAPPSQTTSPYHANSRILTLTTDTTTTTTMTMITPTPPRRSHHNTRSTSPTALATISTSTSTTVLTAHITTFQTPTTAQQSMTTSLATSTTTSTTATPPGKPLLESSPNSVPDWPPALVIFLLSWLVIAWFVTVGLFLASFPEKVAWLDRGIERWREWVGRDRYVKRNRGRDEGWGGFDGLIILQKYFTPIRGLNNQQHKFSHLGSAFDWRRIQHGCDNRSWDLSGLAYTAPPETALFR
jgi:hypothetical protein